MFQREKHTTLRDGKRLLWYTERLWELSKDFTPFWISLGEIAELDSDCWFGSTEPTLREVAKHADRIAKADLSYPIILNDDGSLMDGGHRVCKALTNGQTSILAVKFSEMPTPDEVLDD
jgi:hypothetical protein